MTILDALRAPARRRPVVVRTPAWKPCPEIERCRREIYSVVRTFLSGTYRPIVPLAGQEVRLGEHGIYQVGTFTVGGHGWVYQQGDDFGFVLNTAGHWSYVGRYAVRTAGRAQTVALWTISMGSWPRLDHDGAVTNPGWASPAHVVLAAKMAVAAWRP